LPPQIGELRSLTELNLWGNNLSRLPSKMGNLSKLQKLDLSENQLKELPVTLWKLRELTELYLWGNQLTQISTEIGQLTKLKELILNANPLPADEIGKTLQRLPNLEALYLRNMGFSTLPTSVYVHKNLKRLVLKNRDDAETYRTAPFNNFSAEEQEKIRKRLPGCEVEF